MTDKMSRNMKNTTRIFTAALLAASVFCGCRREDPGFAESGSGTPAETGYISFAGDPLSVQWDGENLNNPANTKADGLSADDFTVDIVDAATGETVKSFLYGQRQEAPIAVPLGKYYVEVRSGEMADIAWEGDAGQPTYGARTAVFEVTPKDDEENPRQIDDIVCKLQSVKVSVWIEQSMADKCDPAETRVEVTLEGQRSVTFDASAAHRYGVVRLSEDMKDVAGIVIDAKAAYLKPVSAENALVMHITGNYAGQPVDFTQTITSAAKAGEWRKIYLYSHTPEDDAGSFVIDVIIETFVYDEVVNVETARLTGFKSEESIPDIDDPDAPRILAPGFTFHDITRVSASDYDTFGNFTRNAAVSVELAAPAGRFAVSLASDNRDFASFLAASGMSGKDIDLMDGGNASLVARTTLKGWGFPGRELLEANPGGLTFNLNAFFRFIKDFTGTHTLSLAVSDTAGRTSSARLVISVTTDGSTSDPAGDDPRIEWVGYDIRKRHVIDDEMTCKIDIYASKGIDKMMISISGAIGKVILEDLAGAMPLEFDLCDTEAYGEGLGTALQGFGFPINEEVRNQTEVVGKMDISAFLAIMPEGESDFALTVTDKEGHSVSETIMLLKQ